MAITPNYGFPYPEASDPVDVAGDIEALAKAIDEDLGELLQDTVGGMVSSNTESGISVTYNDELGKLNFDVTVIPTQSGNTGKYLTTNGTAVSWGEVDALPSQTGNTGKFLTTDGTDASWATGSAGPTGPTGPAGLGITWRGNWVTGPGDPASITYAINDAVSWNNKSWIAIAPSNGFDTPPDNNYSDWNLLADSGDQGATGPTGPSGIISVSSPITNSGTSTEANIGIDLTNIAPIQSPTFTGTVVGEPAGPTDYAKTSSSIGYIGLPQLASTTGAYGLVATDAGTNIYTTASRTITIPANSARAFQVGTTIVFISGPGATTTIQITTDTMYLAGTGSTGTRTLGPHGMATAVKVSATEWYISGNGLT